MSQPDFQIEQLRVVPSSRRIVRGASEVTLSLRAMRVLEMLAQASTQVVSRASLLDAVWCDVTVTDESLTQAITEIRRGFSLLGADRDLVVTVPKAGYRLREHVQYTTDTGDEREQPELVIPLDAYCALIDAQATLNRGDVDGPKIAFEQAREAVALAPDSGWAHASCAIMLVHAVLYSAADPDGIRVAFEHAEKAVALSPQLSLAHAALGFALGACGGEQQAYGSLSKAVALPDKSGEAHYLAARVAFANGDHGSAASLALRAAELVSDPSRPLFLAARAAYACDTSRSSVIAERCVRVLERRLEEDPSEPRSQYTLGPAIALAGDTERASRLISQPGRNQSVSLIHDFFGHLLLKDEMRAMDALENALDDGYRHGHWLRNEPMVAQLHDNPRFQRIVAPLSVN